VGESSIDLLGHVSAHCYAQEFCAVEPFHRAGERLVGLSGLKEENGHWMTLGVK